MARVSAGVTTGRGEEVGVRGGVSAVGCGVALAAAVLAGLALAGCGSSGDRVQAAPSRIAAVTTLGAPQAVPGVPVSPPGAAGGPTTTVPGRMPPTATDPRDPPAPMPDAASPAPPTGSTTCDPRHLRLAQLPGGGGAAGHRVTAVGLSNAAPHSCTIYGYATFTVSAPIKGTGADVTEPVTLHHGQLGDLAFGDPLSTVTLPAGGQAGFLIEYSTVQYGDGGCVATDKLHLTLPGSGATVTGVVHLQVCGEAMLVSPFVPPNRLTTG